MKKDKNLSNQPNQDEMKEVESLFRSNQLDTLENTLNRLILKYPESYMLHNILGVTLQKKGLLEEAKNSFKKAIKINPNFDHGYNNIGNIFKNVNNFKDAIVNYNKAIEINPNYAEAYSNLGNAQKELGNYDDSIQNHKQAIKINPNYAEAYSNLGNALFEMANFAEAANYHNQAIKINPNYAEAYSNLGNALGELGKFDEAIKNYRKSIKINPEYKESILNESLIELTRGNFESSWKGYDFRFYKNNQNLMRYEVNKTWDGSYLDGTLIVWGEQGVGDHILFGSMLSDLKKCAKSVILEIDKRLVNLFKNYFKKINFLNIEVIALEKISKVKFDKHIAIGSLGQYLRKNKEAFKNTPSHFLIPSAEKVKILRNSLFTNKKTRIGISWKTLNKKQQFRNIDIEQMLPILKKTNCEFINLQFGDTKDDLEKIKSKHGINIRNIETIDNFNDIETLAALISCLDLTITIQNSTAHLSSALGKKTWIMLTKNSRWHWTLNEKKSLWYPNAKLFKQDHLGDWNKVINDVSISLKNI